jgi:hypothetical protein
MNIFDEIIRKLCEILNGLPEGTRAFIYRMSVWNILALTILGWLKTLTFRNVVVQVLGLISSAFIANIIPLGFVLLFRTRLTAFVLCISIFIGAVSPILLSKLLCRQNYSQTIARRIIYFIFIVLFIIQLIRGN